MTAAATSGLRPGRPDYAILVTALALVVIGLIFVYSSSFAIALAAYDDVNYFIVRQALSALLGLSAMYALMRLDYHHLRYVSPALMIVAVLGLAAVLFVGDETYGARRWIVVGSMPPIQPSEFAKLAIIIYISAWLASRGRSITSFALGFVPFVCLVGVVAALIVLQPDTGTAAMIVLTTATLFFIAGASLTHILTLATIGGVTAAVLVAAASYRAERIFAFLSAEEDPSGLGFQVLQLLIALGSGGVHGLGLGVSRQKFFYIPGGPYGRHLRDNRRGSGVHRLHARDRAIRLPGLPRHPRRPQRAGRIRRVPGDGRGVLDRVPGADQRRRHHAFDPADRHTVAVRELRRRVARDGDGGGRRAAIGVALRARPHLPRAAATPGGA